jgi:hypothetical protein
MLAPKREQILVSSHITVYAEHAMAINISNLDIGLLVGFFGGVGAFFRAFRIYREYLLLQGTPGMTIRSIPMGLVRIHGKAKSEQFVTSPISHTPCCFYQVNIEKWKDGGENGTWSHYGTETDGVRFYLEDSSGRVLVDAHGAEYDLEGTGVRDVASARASSVAARGPSDAELLSYVARVGPSAKPPGLHHHLELERAMLAAGKALHQPTSPEALFQGLVGPQVSRMQQALEAKGPQSDPLSEEIRLAQIELYKHPFWSPEYEKGRKHVVELQERRRKQRGSKFEVWPTPVAPSNDVVAPAAGPPADCPAPASGRYRLTECCILPDHDYDITGTCAANPEAKDVYDRNLIRKGAKEPTYLISGLAGSDVNTMLRMRAQLMIFGGGMLAVCCLVLLLAHFGLF